MLRPVSFLMRCLMSRERSVARERVGDGHPTRPGQPLDAEAEEVEAVVDVGDCVFSGESVKPHLLCHELGRLLLDRLGLGLRVPAHQHHVGSDRGALPIFRIGAFPRPALRTGLAHY